jgi:Tol biopolymer transport system component
LVHFSGKPSDNWDVYLAPLDSKSQPGDWRRLEISEQVAVPGWFHWSGDSNQIVYVSRTRGTAQTGEQVVHLRNPSTGEDREIYHAQGSVTCVWAVQQPKLFCVDVDEQENSNIFSIAVPSGEVARLHTFPVRMLRIADASRDGRALFMHHSLSGGGELLRWEIATGREAMLGRFVGLGRLGIRPSVSSDEPWLIRSVKQNLEILSTSGGDWRPLVSLSKEFPMGTGHVTFTPDGKWVLYHDLDSTGKHSLFRIAVGGGTPERLGDFPTKDVRGSLEISPDASKIIVTSHEQTSYELWLLENFVPPAPKR